MGKCYENYEKIGYENYGKRGYENFGKIGLIIMVK
jgi:hypothetical protein